MTVKGFNFSPGKTATLTFIQGTVTNKIVSAGVVGTDGTFLQTYTIPATAIVGSAYVRACDVSACVYASISVTAT